MDNYKKNDIENRKDQEEKITVQKKIENRRQNVYRLNLKGFQNKEIAEKLGVSLSTVEKDLHFIHNDPIEQLVWLGRTSYLRAHLDALQHVTMVIEELWQLFNNEENPKLKVSLLTSISQIALNRKELVHNTPDFLGIPGETKISKIR